MWEPVTPIVRAKPKWKPREGESTDAEYRSGAIRSSGEAHVMRVE